VDGLISVGALIRPLAFAFPFICSYYQYFDRLRENPAFKRKGSPFGEPFILTRVDYLSQYKKEGGIAQFFSYPPTQKTRIHVKDVCGAPYISRRFFSRSSFWTLEDFAMYPSTGDLVPPSVSQASHVNEYFPLL
jgi:hypothetical protein